MSMTEPVTVWFTGLSGAGKSTLARALHGAFLATSRLSCVLDGDELRQGLNRDLGFDPDDRRENTRRVAEVARLMNGVGMPVISSTISPYRRDREMARSIVGACRFIEVYVDAPLEICEARDPKGLYRFARNGSVSSFTGVASPYEAPVSPSLRLSTGSRCVDDCIAELWAHLHDRSPT
jgi:adenylyl-sulfate kinase